MRVTTTEAARAVGVSPRTINNWIGRGTLRVDIESPRRRYVDLDQVKARWEWKGAHAKRIAADPDFPR